MASSVELVSHEMKVGRFIANAPNLSAIDAISSQSVDTNTFETHFDSIAFFIVHAIKGRLLKSSVFFLTRPFEPPRAGIRTSNWLIFLLLMSIVTSSCY
jgi:hypothetical protein